MRKVGNRVAAYLVIATLIVVGLAWYFSTLDGAACEDAGSEGCGIGGGALLVSAVVLGTVMPCLVFVGERLARGPRRQVPPK